MQNFKIKIMKIKNLKYFSVLLLSLSLFSCDNFLDINEDPNNVQAEDITPTKSLQGALTNAYRVQARAMNQLGNIYMQNWGGDVNNFTSANNDEYSLAIDNTFYAGIWDGLYPAIYNMQKTIEYNSDDYDNHKAIALIMKSFYMQYIVDLYGNAPYSDAFKGQANTTPSYDDDKAIYRDLVTNINKAIDMFYAADANDADVTASDVIFNGNINKWLRFANTLKMRLLLRQSGLTDPDTVAYLNTEFAKIEASGIYLDVNATINPGYSKATAAQLNPFYSLFKTATGADTQFYGYVRATDYIARWFNGDVSLATNGLVDNRRLRLYNGISDGTVSGAIQGNITGPAEMSQLGLGLFIDTDTPTDGAGDEDGNVMTLAEANFLLAEARDKGYLTGDAKAAFDAGITSSFSLLGATLGSYLSTIDSRPNIGWNGGNHTAAIMTQKWLATNSINAIEAYIDYTRTGFPNVPLATSAQNTHRPYRLLYPTSEYVANSANVPNLLLAQVFVQGPFWKN